MKINVIVVFIVVIVALMVLDQSALPSLPVLAGILAVVWTGFSMKKKTPTNKKKKVVLVDETADSGSDSDMFADAFVDGATEPRKAPDPDIVLTDIGDDEIVRKMQHMGTMPKRSIDARAKFDKHSVMDLFRDELNQHANRPWWDNQDLEQVF